MTVINPLSTKTRIRAVKTLVKFFCRDVGEISSNANVFDILHVEIFLIEMLKTDFKRSSESKNKILICKLSYCKISSYFIVLRFVLCNLKTNNNL